MTIENVVPLKTRSRAVVTAKATDLMPHSLCSEDQDLVDNEITALEVGADVLHMRTVAGLTQDTLAKKVNTDQTTISRLESGRGGHSVTVHKLKRIALACGFIYDSRRALVKISPNESDQQSDDRKRCGS